MYVHSSQRPHESATSRVDKACNEKEQGFLRVTLKKRGWRNHDKSPLGNEYEGSIKNILNFVNVKV